MQKLISESEEIDIDIPNEYFNKDKLVNELNQFQLWKVKTEYILKSLEKELNKPSKHSTHEID